MGSAVAMGIVFGSIAHAGTTATAHFSGAQSMLPADGLSSPDGVAVDARGDVYVADSDLGGVFLDSLVGGVYYESTLPTSGLSRPYGVAVDAFGSVYISDSDNNRVVKETPSPGGGYTQSTMPFSGLNSPEGVAVDVHGNVYVADYLNSRILKDTVSGSTYLQSTVPTSGLELPAGVAVDAQGNVYIADTFHFRVVKETLSGSSYTQSTVADLSSSAPQAPLGVAVDSRGNVYILDYLDDGDNQVLKETPSEGGYTESTVPSGGPQNPYAIAADASGNVYVAEPGGDRIEKLVGTNADFGPVDIGKASSTISVFFTFDTGGTVGRPAVSTQGVAGPDFGDAGTGLCTLELPSHIYEAGDNCAIDVTLKPQLPGARYGAAVLQDSSGNTLASGLVYGIGMGPQVAFPPGMRLPIDSGLANPFGPTVDARGNVFFAESGSGTVYKESLAGGSYARTAIAAGLSHPTGVALDGSGNVYIAASNAVYKETLSNGSYSQNEIVSDLTDLVGIAVDGSGNVYLTASATGDVHKETLQINGSYVETAIGFGISGPTGVAVDGNGNIYITDPKTGELYKETPQPNGSYVQGVIAGGLAGPESVAVDGGGNLYVTGSGSGDVYKEALQANGNYVQTLAASGLDEPWGIAVDGKGNLYLSYNTPRGDLEMIDVAEPPALRFAKTTLGYTSPDSPQIVTVANIGNALLDFPFLSSGTNPSIATSYTLGGTTTCPVVDSSGAAGSLDVGSSCAYAVDFVVPAARGYAGGSLLLTDTSLNAAGPNYATQSIVLSGTAMTSDATRTTMRISKSPVTVGLGVTTIATVVDTTNSATIPEGGGVIFTDTVAGAAVLLNGGAAVPLSDGKAILNFIPGVAGAHTITAHYGGVNNSFAGSTGQASITVRP